MNKWISLDIELPKFRIVDIFKGYTEYIVKNKEGEEFITKVRNSKLWYNLNKNKYTHWKKK